MKLLFLKGNQEVPETEGGRFPLRFGYKPDELKKALSKAEELL